MPISTSEAIYFSPTGTTRIITESILTGLQTPVLQHIDLTTPTNPALARHGRADVTVIGAPVYAGRLPPTMLERFRQIDGNGTPAVIVVVYGNRAYEDALLELRDTVTAAGFIPVAAGAFIGEHSYSTSARPIAAGRPDADDLEAAQRFGAAIRDMLAHQPADSGRSALTVPGNHPYKELRLLDGIAPSTDPARCTACGICVSSCPVEALSLDNPRQADASRCIRCCACVKCCPATAKRIEDPRIAQVAEQLHLNCSQRKAHETFLANHHHSA